MPERNPVVRYGTILRKGGAHTKSVSGTRHRSKRQLDDEIDEYSTTDPVREAIKELARGGAILPLLICAISFIGYALETGRSERPPHSVHEPS